MWSYDGCKLHDNKNNLIVSLHEWSIIFENRLRDVLTFSCDVGKLIDCKVCVQSSDRRTMSTLWRYEPWTEV